MKMKQNFAHAWEKLHLTVSSMATSEEPLETRLRHAFWNQLHRLRSEDLPLEIREDFTEVFEALTKRSEYAALTDDDARRLIESVISMYDRVTRYEDVPE
jgi:hypothetical protein